jgi:hypothetical protein
MGERKDHRKDGLLHFLKRKTHAKLAEYQSRKSKGVARCGVSQMWRGDPACRGATHRLRSASSARRVGSDLYPA